MCIRSIAPSGVLVFALGFWLVGNATAHGSMARHRPAVQTLDADTHERIAKAMAKTATGDAEDFLDGLDVLQKLADRGASEAQLTLGRFYQYGHPEVLCRDDARALEWFSKAADQGVVEAKRRLGDIYNTPDSPFYNAGKAATWYQEGANFDDMESQAALSGLYLEGNGVQKDAAKSLYWLEEAANHPDGVQYALSLGDRYRGVREYPVRDDDKAIYWYLRAANGGQGDAQHRLAAMYDARGNYFEAYRWYAMAVTLEKKTAESKPVYLQDNHQTGGKDPVGMSPDGIEEDIRARNKVAARLTQGERANADKWVDQQHMTPVWAVPILVSSMDTRYCKPPALSQR